MRAWLGDLRAVVGDLTAAAEYATRALGRRNLGRAAARRIVVEASDAIEKLLAAAERGVTG